jgi:hypothetical protein
MPDSLLLLAITVALLAVCVLLALLLHRERRPAASDLPARPGRPIRRYDARTKRSAGPGDETDLAYRRGYLAGKEAVRRAVRYDREIYDCKHTGLLKREVLLRIRETVWLEQLKIAEWEREVTLNSEVDLATVWQAVDRLLPFVPAGRVGTVVRGVAPAAAGVLNTIRNGRPPGRRASPQA